MIQKLIFASSEQDSNKDNGFTLGVPDGWFSARWSCKVGASVDEILKKNLIVDGACKK